MAPGGWIRPSLGSVRGFRQWRSSRAARHPVPLTVRPPWDDRVMPTAAPRPRLRAVPPLDDAAPRSALQFAETVRQVVVLARHHRLRPPVFRSPPRLEGVDRSIRRRPNGTVVVAVRRVDRPLAVVQADVIEGVLAANGVVGSRRTVRHAAWERLTGGGDRPAATRTGGRYGAGPCRPSGLKADRWPFSSGAGGDSRKIRCNDIRSSSDTSTKESSWAHRGDQLVVRPARGPRVRPAGQGALGTAASGTGGSAPRRRPAGWRSSTGRVPPRTGSPGPGWPARRPPR